MTGCFGTSKITCTKYFCRKFLCEDVLDWLRDVTGIPLSNKVDITCSKYDYTGNGLFSTSFTTIIMTKKLSSLHLLENLWHDTNTQDKGMLLNMGAWKWTSYVFKKEAWLRLIKLTNEICSAKYSWSNDQIANRMVLHWQI